MLQKIMEIYLFPTLVQYAIINVTFDLRILRTRFDTFALLVNFINDQRVPCHLTIGFFETPNTTRIVLDG